VDRSNCSKDFIIWCVLRITKPVTFLKGGSCYGDVLRAYYSSRRMMVVEGILCSRDYNKV